MNNKGLQFAELAKGIDGGLAMQKNITNSSALSDSIKKQRELAAKQAERLGKLVTPTLPKFDTTRIAGFANLGNTCTH